MTDDLRQRAIAAFRKEFGHSPRWLAIAPGRVNLIGEHTDYNGGHVLPMAVDRRVVVAADASRGELSRFWSELDGTRAEFETGRTGGRRPEGWARYVAGTAAVLAWEGAQVKPVEAAVVADLPPGAGLSSSAALEAASALAFLAVAGQPDRFAPDKLALICQKAEHKFAGVMCGIMDQFSVMMGRDGEALYLDCHNLFAQHVPLPGNLAVLVADSGVPRRLADAEYNERRADCEAAADHMSTELGRRVNLAEVTHEELVSYGRKVLDERQFRRARHVVGEEMRTARAVEFLKRGQLEAFGETARESHRSLAEDFEVSCPELDTLVRLACELDGVYGARLTGAGFGGAAVVFCAASRTEEVAAQLRDYYKVETGLECAPARVRPASGARVEEFRE
ncbi:MAG: galactokinase [Planctomycetota bacterium]